MLPPFPLRLQPYFLDILMRLAARQGLYARGYCG